jgi:hypothetical protein
MTLLDDVIKEYNRLKATPAKHKKKWNALEKYVSDHFHVALPDAKKINDKTYEYPIRPECFDKNAPYPSLFAVNRYTAAVIGMEVRLLFVDSTGKIYSTYSPDINSDPSMCAVRIILEPASRNFTPHKCFLNNYEDSMRALERIGNILSGKDTEWKIRII